MSAMLRQLVPFAAEVANVQVREADEGLAALISSAVAAHRVVILRGQVAEDSDFVRFLRMLGELTFTAGETPVSNAPDLNVVSNVGRTTPPRSVFHTDTSYVAQPPALGALRAVSLPISGGATLFSDQVRAADSLPSAARDWLRGRTLLHGVKGTDGNFMQMRHPILTRHPVTGEMALFLSTPERCTGLSGVDPPLSARVVNLLYLRSVRASQLYRHEWRTGDIVIWDNRATMHRADHTAVAGDRVLHRGLVLGEVPQAA